MAENRRVRISRPESFLSAIVAPERLDGERVSAGARATGFFWERHGNWYLITNVHVLTGWNHHTGKSLSANGFMPSHVSFQVAVDLSADDAAGELVQRRGFRVSLEEDDEPAWLIHPAHKTKVDVAALRVFEKPDDSALKELKVRRILSQPVNEHGGWTEYEIAAGEDAYVLGYPKGMATSGFPIWKRASIASEPDMDIDGLPKLLVDTATREGMSGAPVIAVRRGITMPSGKFGRDSIIGECMKFLGVYSGRIGEDELGVQLGIVWKASVVDEIIDGATRGKWPWHSS